MKIRLVLLVTVLFSTLCVAQTIPPDKGVLERGEGAGAALYADINGYPSPKHVIDMADELNLSEQQLKDVQSIFDDMAESARAKGEEIIAREQEYHTMFKAGKATEAGARKLAVEIGRLRGELRAVHMIAHIQTKDVLTNDQIARYTKARLKARAAADKHSGSHK
jgi:Spy/CpxP family protein refolding chaperone